VHQWESSTGFLSRNGAKESGLVFSRSFGLWVLKCSTIHDRLEEVWELKELWHSLEADG